MATTPYMSLNLPTVSVTAGPAWASQINAALTVLDGHTHTSGSGVPVPSSGLNINAPLPFNGFDATSLRSLRLADQGAPLALGTDIGCLYEAGGALYYNNSAGQQIQITAGAALNATSLGGWGGDYATSTASAFYTSASQTFTLNQSANTRATLDIGSLIIRQPGVASPQGITLQSPSGLAASYALTLPAALPASTSVLLLSATGAISASASPTLAGLTVSGAANLLGAANVTGLATLSGGATVAGGDLALTTNNLAFTKAGSQTLYKSGGPLLINVGDNNPIDFYVNTFPRWRIDPATGNLMVLGGGTNTIAGLPAPAAPDQVANKGYVDASPPAPTAMSLGTNWSGSATYTRKAGFVALALNVQWVGLTSSPPATAIATLPIGYTPQGAVFLPATINSGATPTVLVRITTSGVISVLNGTMNNNDVLNVYTVLPAL